MKDILIRAGKTFIQAALAVLVITFQNGIDLTNKEAINVAIIAALSAGISALMNFILGLIKKWKSLEHIGQKIKSTYT